MATRRQPLIPGWLVPGLLAAVLMVVVSLGAFLALWFNAPESDLLALWHDSYLWHVIRFSCCRRSRPFSLHAPSIADVSPAGLPCCGCAR